MCHVPNEAIIRGGADVNKLQWVAREERIFKVILNAFPDIFGCQEIRNLPKDAGEENWEMKKRFRDVLEENGYEIISTSNNDTHLSFANLIGFKKDKYHLEQSWNWWNNKSNPEEFGVHPRGDKFGRVTVMCKLHPILEDGCIDKSKSIFFVNTHPGIVSHEARMDQHQITLDKIAEKVGDVSALVFVVGDMNCFPDDNGSEEIALYTKNGFMRAENLTTSEGIPVSGTFTGYTYDRFIPEKGHLSTQLDHIFFKKMNPIENESNEIECTSTVDLKRHDGTDKPVEKLEDYLVDPETNEDLRNLLPSDHCPLTANFIIN